MGYSNKTFACPYFKWDEKLGVHCECGCVRFRDRREAKEYQDAYCASVHGWKHCTAAQSATKYFERMDEHGEKRG